jgi:hypothetical protein
MREQVNKQYFVWEVSERRSFWIIFLQLDEFWIILDLVSTK